MACFLHQMFQDFWYEWNIKIRLFWFGFVFNVLFYNYCVFPFICLSVCRAVGVEDKNKIPDARMTASTFHSSFHYPYYGRLNGIRGRGAWCALTASDKTDYLQVDMGAVHSVCAVATQGYRTGSVWTIRYKVHHSKDGVTWKSCKEDNVNKVTKIIYSSLGVGIYKEIIKLSQ